MNTREEFRAIVSGWTLTDDFDGITDYIEAAAEWAKRNGPLWPDEEATIRLMIECQIARAHPRPLEAPEDR